MEVYRGYFGGVTMGEMKNVICTVCDLNCTLKMEVENNRILSMEGYPDKRVFCPKPLYWDDYVNHPNRVIYPMKNLGKRGEQKWQRISWEQALDEIAEKLKRIIDKYGPESLAVSTMHQNPGDDQGIIRRFMNLLGTPNYLTGVLLCFGNTIQVHRLTFGNGVAEDFSTMDCIMLLGHNPHKNNWVGQAVAIDDAVARGAKMIVLDPRKSENARRADIHLPLRYGTDAAMLLGFIHVIIEEELYDKEFVEKYTYGFEQLRERVREYPLKRVAQITGCREEDIAAAARMYAKAERAIIPWGPIPDMQVNSTSVIRCQDILMTICGHLGKSEPILFPSPDLVTYSEIERYDLLAPEQKAKLLGADKYRVFSYEGYEPFREPAKRVYGIEWLNLASSFMAIPGAVFEAMRGEGPYPVKAFFTLGSNALMGYTNQQGVFDAMMKQELIVDFDNWLTPTGQLADYVLPGDYYLERPAMKNQDHMPGYLCQQQVLKPRGECKNIYFVIKGLADRMGLSEYFPWKDQVEVLDYRLSRGGKTWDEVKGERQVGPSRKTDVLKTGIFATPTGKIELYSTALEKMGYDPLPYYREPLQTPVSNPQRAEKYPLTVFVGLRDKGNYLTNLRQIPGLRRMSPFPEIYINPADAAKYGAAEGSWVWVETIQGRMLLKVKRDEVQPEGTIRVPHGWWMPELSPGLETGLSGAMFFNDALILPDAGWNSDLEQGVPNLRGGLLARVYPAREEELCRLKEMTSKKMN